MVDQAAQAWFDEWLVEQVAGAIAEAVRRGVDTWEESVQWARRTNDYPGFTFERPPVGYFNGKRIADWGHVTIASDLHLSEDDLDRAIGFAKDQLA